MFKLRVRSGTDANSEAHRNLESLRPLARGGDRRSSGPDSLACQCRFRLGLCPQQLPVGLALGDSDLSCDFAAGSDSPTPARDFGVMPAPWPGRLRPGFRGTEAARARLGRPGVRAALRLAWPGPQREQ